MSVKMTIALDTRNKCAKTPTYPVVLLVRIDSNPRRFPTIHRLTVEDFSKLKATRLSSVLSSVKDDLKLIQNGAEMYVKEKNPFDLVDFENDFICGNALFKPRKFKIKKPPQDSTEFDFTPYLGKFPIFREDHSNPLSVSSVYFFCIKRLIKQRRIGNALIYQDSYNHIKKFRGNLPLTNITVDWLFEFEYWLTDRGCSKATIGIKLRPLRTIFNKAIKRLKIIKPEIYPFGSENYQIPTGQNIKKAWSREDLKQLYYYTPEDHEERRALDYWLFLYFANGMNPKDAAYLRNKNIQGDFITFYRAKTENTARSNPKLITVYITDELRIIMERLSARQKGPDAFLFPVMDDNLNPVEQHFQVRSFVKFINDRMKRIARRNGIDQKATTIVTRHSRATHLKQAGASTEFIQETLGHMDKRTTENYLDSFEDELKKEFAKKLSIM